MITLKNITQEFSNEKGVFDVSFRVNKGEVFGFLGPNGSGKTTTMRHLLGFMKPQRGSAFINDLNAWKQQAKGRQYIGYLPGEIEFLDGLTGDSFLDMMAGMQGVNHPTRRDQLINLMQLDHYITILKMSKGTKQKVGIVATFMHDPEIYLLDEPTAGLDPLMQQTFVELVLKEKARGKTFLISSHSLSEVERTCDRVAIIRKGYIVTIKDIHQLHAMQRKACIVTLSHAEDVQALMKSKLQTEKIDDLIIRIELQGNYTDFLHILSQYEIKNISIDNQNLEHIFLDYYAHSGDQS